jgi:ATP-binding cassette subfamily B protein
MGRVAAVRADRDLLILGEPSSGMDAESEHALRRRLCAIREGKASLLISHRLGSVRDADGIYVLSGGQITESGTLSGRRCSARVRQRQQVVR